MNLSQRERRLITMLGVSLVISLIVYIATSDSSSPASTKTAGPVASVERAEKMLTSLRLQAATIPGKQAALKSVTVELAQREKGLIKGDTAPQAQAQLLQVLREVARNQAPPIDIRQVELGQAQPFGDGYGQVSVSVTVDCGMAQLVNYMAFLSAQPEVISTDQVRFANSNPKTKTNQVRVTITGLVPRKLVPEKKGLASF